MYGSDLLAAKLRERLEEKIFSYNGRIRMLRFDKLGGNDEDAIVDLILRARHNRYIADEQERWLKFAEHELPRANTIDDLLVVLDGGEHYKNLSDMTPAEIANLPPLGPGQVADVAEVLDDPRYVQGTESGMSWSEASGTDAPAPPNWQEPVPTPRGRVRGRRPSEPQTSSAVDPTETMPPRPAGPAEVAERSPGTVRDARSPAPAESAGPSTVKVGLEAAGAAATVAAAAKRGWSVIRILRFGVGGILVFVLAYGGWRLWGYATGPGETPTAAPNAASGSLESITASGILQEKASAYATTPFQTEVSVHSARLLPDFPGDVSVTLEGETEFEGTFDCYAQPPGSVSGAPRTLFIERRPIMVKLAYEKVEVTTKDVGTYDPTAGTFSMPMELRIVRNFFLLLRPFTDSRCTYYNANGPQPEWTDQFFGTGSIEGTASFTSGAVSVHTRWEWGNGIKVEGETTLTGKLERT